MDKNKEEIREFITPLVEVLANGIPEEKRKGMDKDGMVYSAVLGLDAVGYNVETLKEEISNPFDLMDLVSMTTAFLGLVGDLSPEEGEKSLARIEIGKPCVRLSAVPEQYRASTIMKKADLKKKFYTPGPIKSIAHN